MNSVESHRPQYVDQGLYIIGGIVHPLDQQDLQPDLAGKGLGKEGQPANHRLQVNPSRRAINPVKTRGSGRIQGWHDNVRCH